MTIYVPCYLRPLSEARTGNQSRVEQKAEEVNAIRCSACDDLIFKQQNPVDQWVNEQAYHGTDPVTSDREIRVEGAVNNPERHWWIVSQSLLEEINPSLREHADIFDLLITLNLCTDDPVFFSQNPGQTVSGAYDYDRGALRYKDQLSIGNPATALLWANEIPEAVEISDNVAPVYEMVREYRSKKIETDAEADIRVALHMYEDALSSNLWTATTNLYYVCENVLATGRSNMDQLMAGNTALSQEESAGWRETVNRLKHPDKGDSIDGVLDQEELMRPSLVSMRRAANEVLKEAMSDINA